MKIFKLILTLFIVLGVIGVIYSLGSQGTKASVIYPPMDLPGKTEPDSVKEMASGDGSIKVTAKIQRLADGNKYTFIVTNNLSSDAKAVYEVSEDKSVSYSIPGNSWAPDNKHFFIIRSATGDTRYLVFKADGNSFGDMKFLDIGEFWLKTKHNLPITEATGWGGEDLIVLKTKQVDGTAGPNFWFVVSSKSFLQLNN